MRNRLEITVSEHKNSVNLIKRVSPYSIIKDEEERISLCSGLNVFDSLKYGFYFDFFSNPYDILSINLKDYDTSNVVNMSRMFADCLLNNLDLSGVNASNVINMYAMFRGCQNLVKLDLSSFDTSKVTNMASMFHSCHNLEILDLSNFDMSNITMRQNMFYGCYKLKHIRCKRGFKDWCLENKQLINMPYLVRSSNEHLWDIID